MTEQREPPASDAAAPPRSTRDRLLAVAFELLLEQGYRDTTVQAVARRAGLTIGAIYANFENRHHLLAEAALKAWDTDELATQNSLADTEFSSEDFNQILAFLMSMPATPQHRLLTEITGASMPEMKEDSPILQNLRNLDRMTRFQVQRAQERGDIDPAVPTEGLVNLLVNTMLGSWTSKALGLPQPSFEESLAVFRRYSEALRPAPSDQSA